METSSEDRALFAELLYPIVYEKYPVFAHHITNILLDSNQKHLLYMLENNHYLNMNIQDAIVDLIAFKANYFRKF